MAITARNRRKGNVKDIPTRKPDCKFYGRCLDTAAKQDASLECAACLRYWRQPFEHLDTREELCRMCV
jgi:hypothetical protein